LDKILEIEESLLKCYFIIGFFLLFFNILNLFEQILIWGGILLLLHDKEFLGGLGIALSSVFKLITATLLPLVLIIRRTWKSFWIAAVLASITLATYIWTYYRASDFWSSFFYAASSLDERGNRCPSSLSLFRDLADALGMGTTFVYVLYAFLCCLVIFIIAWSFFATRRSPDRYPMLYLTILGYVLLAPRMKDYSLIIAILPTLHIISAMASCRRQAIIGSVLLWIPIINYQSLLLAALVFMLDFHWIWKYRKVPTKRMELTLNPLHIFSEIQTFRWKKSIHNSQE
jgi:hypothetical protein